MPLSLQQALAQTKEISRMFRLGQLSNEEVHERMTEVHSRLGKNLKEAAKPAPAKEEKKGKDKDDKESK